MSRASDAAYKIIRDEILSGRLPPRMQLSEGELAHLCGTSRTPIRDALRRLESEMLVRRTETQRTFIAEWDSHALEDLFELRALLEGYAAVRAATRITTAEIDQLKRYNDKLRESVIGPANGGFDEEAWLTYNRHFHHAILDASQSERLQKMRSLLVEEVVQHRTARSFSRSGLLRSHADHEDLVLAFELRDAEWARSIMNSHILRALHVTLGRSVMTSGHGDDDILEEREIAAVEVPLVDAPLGEALPESIVRLRTVAKAASNGKG